MKILELRKKIIKNATVAAIAFLLFCGSVFYKSYINSKLQKESETILNETSAIQSQSQEIQSKTIEIKKYLAIWNNLDERKKSPSAIKMDDVNNSLSSNAVKYNISSPIIKVSVPESLPDSSFNLTTLTPSFATIDLTFKALDDVKALLFINDFTESLPGYVVINDAEVKKDKNYTDEDLIAISSGKGSGIIEGKVSFSWYTFRDKKPKPTEDKKQNVADSKKQQPEN